MTESNPCRVVYLSETPPLQREPFADYGDLLSVGDLCRITGQSDQTVRHLCATSKLPAVHIGRRWYVPKTLFIDYLSGVHHG